MARRGLVEDRFVTHAARTARDRHDEDVVLNVFLDEAIDRLRQDRIGWPEEFEPERPAFASRISEFLGLREREWMDCVGSVDVIDRACREVVETQAAHAGFPVGEAVAIEAKSMRHPDE